MIAAHGDPGYECFRQAQRPRTWASELLYAPGEPDMGHRHVDMIWPLWNLFDYTPDGRGASWYPKPNY